jgi:hypothetical protein
MIVSFLSFQGGRKRKAVESSSEEEWSPVKRSKKVAKATKAKPRRTATRKKT